MMGVREGDELENPLVSAGRGLFVTHLRVDAALGRADRRSLPQVGVWTARDAAAADDAGAAAAATGPATKLSVGALCQ